MLTLFSTYKCTCFLYENTLGVYIMYSNLTAGTVNHLLLHHDEDTVHALTRVNENI